MDYYKPLRKDGGVEIMPFVKLPQLPSYKVIEYHRGIHRLDKLAEAYYGSPFYDKLILLANPEYMMDAQIPDGALLKIPFPLDVVLKHYYEALREEISR